MSDEDIQLSETQMEEIKEAFDLFDPGETGFMSIDNLLTAMRALGYNPNEAELLDIIDELDPEETGTFSYTNFYSMMEAKMTNTGKAEELYKTLKAYDYEEDGYITSAELRKALLKIGETLTEEEIDEMVREADVDGDGIIDYAEFVLMITEE